MKCLLIFFICLGLTSAEYNVWGRVQSVAHAWKFPLSLANLFPSCGIKGSQDRIEGGTVAQKNSIPWIAQVLIKNKVISGGAIIGKYHILTVATTFSPGYGYGSIGDITVKVNKLYRDPNHIEDGAVDHDVECLSIYPGYNSPYKTKNYAILILKQPIVSELATPVCLPAPQSNIDFFEGREMTVSGWGFTTWQADNVYYSSVLKRAKVRGISHKRCRNEVKFINFLNNNQYVNVDEFMICTERVNGDPCVGDSGGPLTFHNGTNHVLAGLVSFNTCGGNPEPVTYSRVSFAEVIDWIKQHGLYTGTPVCPK